MDCAIQVYSQTSFFFKAHGSVHHNSTLIKIQPDGTVCRYLFTAKLLYIVEERETNLMPLVLLLLYSVLNMFQMLIHPTSGACDLFVELFHGLYCSGSMCVGVML